MKVVHWLIEHDWKILLVLTLLYLVLYKGGAALAWYEEKRCKVANNIVQSFEICVKSSPGSAFCSVTPSDLDNYRDASYHQQTKVCREMGG